MLSLFDLLSVNNTKAASAHLNSTPLMTCQALGAGWGGGFWGWVSAGGSLPTLPLLVTCGDRGQSEDGGRILTHQGCCRHHRVLRPSKGGAQRGRGAQSGGQGAVLEEGTPDPSPKLQVSRRRGGNEGSSRWTREHER